MRATARRLFYGLRSEGAGAGREAAAVGVGVFIGCLPLYGFHLVLCWITGWVFGLNRLKIYLAANISNPLIAPLLIFSELQTGAWVRRGVFHELSLQAARTTDLSVFGLDILTGSLTIGTTLGAVIALVTYLSVRGTADDALFLDLVRDASDRYMRASILTWEFARGKLRGDPLYRSTVCGGLLPSGGTLVDIGCGNGLTLAILAEAQTRFKEGRWPATWNPPPQFDCLIGIEVRARPVGVAREALGSDATIIHGDARATNVGPCRVVLLFDVLHMLGPSEQEALLAAVSASLEPGGVALIREADASGGWRFAAVRFGNRVKALAFGHWRQPFDFRTTDEWLACFASHGLAGQVRPMSAGTPFANVLFRVTVSAPVSATSGRP
jgi:SAM-dependent methyltransferase